jgi:hypothetical protein
LATEIENSEGSVNDKKVAIGDHYKTRLAREGTAIMAITELGVLI